MPATRGLVVDVAKSLSGTLKSDSSRRQPITRTNNPLPRFPHVFALARRRVLWWPTLLGWACLLMAFASVVLAWVFAGEKFLSLTHREPAEILVVEGWIGTDGVAAARAEFLQGGYRYIVTCGSSTPRRWGKKQWNYANEAEQQLRNEGLPPECIIAAPAPEMESQRTYESALAVRRAMESRGILRGSANVFTLNAHARRSRLVFARALGSETRVGVVSWFPKVYTPGPWWHSSERAEDFLKESAGYLFERLLGSGRSWKTRPDENAPTSAGKSLALP